jgi:hypothetical protein
LRLGFFFIVVAYLVLNVSCNNQDIELSPENASVKMIPMQGSESFNFCKETNDGNYIVGGAVNFDAFIAKIDTLGSLLWYKTAGNNDDDYFFDAAETSKGDIIAVGFSRDQKQLNSYLPFMAQFDTEGNVLMQSNEVIEGPLAQSAIVQVLPISDEKFVSIAQISELNQLRPRSSIMLIDTEGQLLREHREFNYRWLAQYDENHFVAVGTVLNGSVYNLVLCMFDFELNKVYTKILNKATALGAFVNCRLEKTNKGYVILNFKEITDDVQVTELVIVDEELKYEESVLAKNLYVKMNAANINMPLLYGETFSMNIIAESNMKLEMIDKENSIQETLFLRSDIQAQDVLYAKTNDELINLVVSFKNYNSNSRSIGLLKMNRNGEVVKNAN